MRCEYYIQKEIVIEYLAKNCKIYTVYTNRTVKKGFVFSYPNEGSDDLVTTNQTSQDELERKIKENTYDKILFKNGKWINETYRKMYENYLNDICSDFSQLLRVYKKITAMETM
jgi:hypothetical protein